MSKIIIFAVISAGDQNMAISAQMLGNLDLETYQWDFDNT